MLSHPSRGAWIEITDRVKEYASLLESHPSRGAWIEMTTLRIGFASNMPVAPLTGCVD